MASDQNRSAFLERLAEDIIDRDWIEAGMTPLELQQSKSLVFIESRLAAEGRSIDDIYSEWAASNPSEIIERYSYILKERQKELRPPEPKETSRLHVRFLKLEPGHPLVAHFQINNSDSAVQIPQEILKFDVNNTLLNRFVLLKEGDPVSIKMLVTPTAQGTVISLSDVKPERTFRQTFNRSYRP